MNDNPSTETDAPDSRPPLQFSLRQMLGGTAVVCMFLSVAASVGWLWAGVVLGASGVLLALYGWVLKRPGMWKTGIAFLIAFLVIGLALPAVNQPSSFWSGQRRVSLKFVVSDAVMGHPIRGATVRIRDIQVYGTDGRPQIPTPAAEPGVQGQTDARGRVRLSHSFQTWGEGNEDGTVSIHLGRAYWLQVTAPGYQTLLIPLSDQTGESSALTGVTLPPIRIELQRTATNEAVEDESSSLPLTPDPTLD